MLKISKKVKLKQGFTLIELLVVIAIIGLIASSLLVALNNARLKARDVRRYADISQIRKALDIYYGIHNQYPASDGEGCGGWDTPGDGDFIEVLRTEGITKSNLKDPSSNHDCGNYRYYRYPAGTYGCDAGRGAFYVLGVVNTEFPSGGKDQYTQGWSCPGRDWGNEFELVTGKYEK